MPLSYLMSLQHASLPKKVVTLVDVRHVSILKATGLIEAEIAPALDGSGTYKNARKAVVMRITEDGMAEINRMRIEETRMTLARNAGAGADRIYGAGEGYGTHRPAHASLGK
jgi:hypothetical protein